MNTPSMPVTGMRAVDGLENPADLVVRNARIYTGDRALPAASAVAIRDGGIATVNLIAEPGHRAQVVAAFFACAFAGLTIPSVSVGLASQSIGTKDATLYCAIVIGALALLALTAIRRGQGARAPVAAQPAT